MALIIIVASRFFERPWRRAWGYGLGWPLFVLIGMARLQAGVNRGVADALSEAGRNVAGKKRSE
jgi:hypothetical protein